MSSPLLFTCLILLASLPSFAADRICFQRGLSATFGKLDTTSLDPDAKPQGRWKHPSWEDAFLDRNSKSAWKEAPVKLRDPPHWKMFGGSVTSYFRDYFASHDSETNTLEFGDRFYARQPETTVTLRQRAHTAFANYVNELSRRESAGELGKSGDVDWSAIDAGAVDRAVGKLIAERANFSVVGLKSGEIVLEISPTGKHPINRMARHLASIYGPQTKIIYWPSEMRREGKLYGAYWDPERKKILVGPELIAFPETLPNVVHEATHALTNMGPEDLPDKQILDSWVTVKPGQGAGNQFFLNGTYDQQFRVDEASTFARGAQAEFRELLVDRERRPNGSALVVDPKNGLVAADLLYHLRWGGAIAERLSRLADATDTEFSKGTLKYRLTPDAAGGTRATLTLRLDGRVTDLDLGISRDTKPEDPSNRELLRQRIQEMKNFSARYTVFYQYLQVVYDRVAAMRSPEQASTLLRALQRSWYNPRRSNQIPKLRDLINRFNTALASQEAENLAQSVDPNQLKAPLGGLNGGRAGSSPQQRDQDTRDQNPDGQGSGAIQNRPGTDASGAK